MDTFGLKIGIEGERDFRNSLREINNAFKVLGSEMALISSEFDKNDNSIQALTARSAMLNKEMDAQRDKITTLEAAHRNAAASFGENDKRTQAWAIQLNNAKAALNNMEREMDGNNKALRDVERGYNDAGQEVDEFGRAVEQAADDTEKSGKKFEQLGGLLKGVGTGIGAVVVAAGAAAIKLGAEVVQQFGELEQNLGGSEAVFGEYASRIQKTGEDAYKNLGVSQSQYLATANKMGALFQGSGIEQQRSLELTEQAMQRAADMASVMGISVESAMESVTGAAKGNFSMMDNLGVSMNATSVEAYALSKGLDFAWASASNAEKAEVAMQMFFEKTEQYSGNFANEATQTISGSIGLLQAAVGSFTAGLGNADADMENLTQNLVDAFQAVVTNIVPVLENIVSALPTATDAILQAIADLLPMLLETVMNLFTQVLETILGLLPELIPAAVDAVMTIVDALIENLPLLVDAAVQLILALVEGIGSALPELVPAAIQAVITIVEGLLENLPLILDTAMQLLFGLADGLIAALPILIDALPHIIDTIINFLVNNLPRLIEMGVELVIKLALGLVQAIPNLLSALPQILGSLINGMMQWHSKIGEMGKNIIQSLWNGIIAMGQWLADNFSGMIAGIVNTVVNAINSVLGTNIPTMTVKAAVNAEPVDTGSIQNAENVLAQIAKESEQVVIESNESALKSSTATANERINLEKSVISGRNTESREQERIAQEQAKEEEKIAKELAKEKERIAKENADAINKLGDDLTKALKEQYDEQKTAYLDALNEEVDAVKSASYEKIRVYDEEYAEKMKLLDDEGNSRLSAIQAEIDAIDELTRAEDKAKREQEYNDKLEALKVEFNTADTNAERDDIQDEINDLVASRQREVTLEQRNAQKDLLKQQLEDEKQAFKDAQAALEQSKLDELEIRKDALNEQFSELMSSENLKTEALKLLMSGQQDELLALLDTYYPEWRNAGLTFAEMLGVGMEDGAAKVQTSLADTLNLISGLGGTTAAPAVGSASATGQSVPGSFTGSVTGAGSGSDFMSAGLDNDTRSVFGDIQSALADISQAVKQSAAEIYAKFENPLQGEFSRLGIKMDAISSAIGNINSMLSSLPSITINNTFNGVTAADVPHMVDRENTALLRRLQPRLA